MTTSSPLDLLQNAYRDGHLIEKIKASNVLLVGAGGIGCEVLKGLLLNGFPKITLVDLDTIDVSNLNRQFLYNKSHVGKSKAEIAARVSVERYSLKEKGVPLSSVQPLHDTILNVKYNKQFYNQFTFVINALDNNSTRVHVNRMCLAANIPLVESGSAGYFGNARLILKGVTQCFECEPPKKDENTYASCTIRNTPSLPIHCIVWGKHLFAQLFGQADEDISPDANVNSVNDSEGSNSVSGNLISPIIYYFVNIILFFSNFKDKPFMTTREYVESTDYDPNALFNKIFRNDIWYLRSMTNLWKNRKEPRELDYEKIENNYIIFSEPGSSKNDESENNDDQLPDQRLWDSRKCLQIFVESLNELKQRVKVEKILKWDKDDEAALNFVSAVSNFRCYCFHIPRKSKFDIKALAGNIIPAISSTNTVVGGYILMLTLKMLDSILPQRIWKTPSEEFISSVADVDVEKLKHECQLLHTNCFSVFITNKCIPGLSKIAMEPLLKPKANCMACSSETKEIIVALPFDKTTLAYFIDRIVMKKFKCIAPDVNVFEQRKMLWAADDEEELHDSSSYCHTKMLSSYSFLVNNSIVQITDLEQDFKVNICLRNIEFEEDADGDGELFKILNQTEFDTIHNNDNDKLNNNLNNNGLNNVKNNGLTDVKNNGLIDAKVNQGIKRPIDSEFCIEDDEDELVCLNEFTTVTKRTKVN